MDNNQRTGSYNLEEFLALAGNRDGSQRDTQMQQLLAQQQQLQQLQQLQQQQLQQQLPDQSGHQQGQLSSLQQQQLQLQGQEPSINATELAQQQQDGNFGLMEQNASSLLQQQLMAQSSAPSSNQLGLMQSSNTLLSGASGTLQGMPGVAGNAGIGAGGGDLQSGEHEALQQMLQLRSMHAGLDSSGGMGAQASQQFQPQLGDASFSNNDMLLQLLQQQQQQQLLQQQQQQLFPQASLGMGSMGGANGLSNSLSLEQQLLLRQQQELQGVSVGGFLPGLGGGLQSSIAQQGGNDMQSNNLLLQLLQQQHQQQQQQQQGVPPQLFNSSMNAQLNLGVPSNLAAATSNPAQAQLLNAMSQAPVPSDDGPKAIKKKAYKKRPKDKPKRPLSAYNFFFKEERARILEEAEKKAKEAEATGEKKEGEGKEAKKEEEEKSAPRKGRGRPHGKISFEDLGRLISQRWQDLNPKDVEYYKAKSDKDRKRYQAEMDVYRKKKAGN